MFDGVKVLLVEDDPAVRMGGEEALQLAGFEVESYESAERVRNRITPGCPSVIVCDVKLPGMDGLALLRYAVSADTQLPVILVTGHGDISMAVQAMRDGAYDFIEKPFASEKLVEVVQRALEKRQLTLEVQALRRKLENRQGIEATLLGRSPTIEAIRQAILDLADTEADILLDGETGTGKELVARALHEHSRRAGAHFVALNCGGLPETLFDSELFGHEAGAFTGAAKRRIGKLEYANGGTLFLDEIDSMPPSMQVKLLRFLQEHVIERLGSNEPIRIDCRIVAASQGHLKELMAQNKFRTDLYYRLSVVVFELPPLRERREDIPLLFEHFVLQAAQRYGREAPIMSATQILDLMSYPWPGNVRELRNVADRFVLGALGRTVGMTRFQKPERLSLAEQVEQFERAMIEDELRRHRGNTAIASEALGVPKTTLYDKMRRFHLAAEDFR
jgi:two-component system C4-dicarboxylate transport response regulator DctD